MIWLWTGFVALIMAMLASDLGVFNRKAHKVSVREAATWTVVWIAAALLFNIAVYFLYEHHVFGLGTVEFHTPDGKKAALEFFTGYLIEKSLSLDNLFVIALIFQYFHVRSEHQHRVLVYGVVGALILRGGAIAAGVALIHRFEWITYVFGGLLVVGAIKMLATREGHSNLENNPLLRTARKILPLTDDYHGQKFWTRIDGKFAFTPMFLVILVVESSDLLFAIDSIPAIFAITVDPFLVFTSNVFAILGLRALYFVLAGVLEKFKYLKFSLAVILVVVGGKMLLNDIVHIPTWVSLMLITLIMLGGIVASMYAHAIEPLADPMTSQMEFAADIVWRRIRRVLIIIAGVVLIVMGLIMIVTPGPAVVVIPAGLAILATEFVWARKLLKTIKEKGAAAIDLARTNRSNGTGQSSAATVDDSEKD